MGFVRGCVEPRGGEGECEKKKRDVSWCFALKGDNPGCKRMARGSLTAISILRHWMMVIKDHG